MKGPGVQCVPAEAKGGPAIRFPVGSSRGRLRCVPAGEAVPLWYVPAVGCRGVFQPWEAEVCSSRERLRYVTAKGGFPVCPCMTAQRRGEEDKIEDKIVN